MAWERQGLCNKCSDCCRNPVVVDSIVCPRTENRCLFFDDGYPNNKQFGACLIFGRKGPVSRVKDRHGTTIIQAQIDYWTAVCQPYPALRPDGLPPTFLPAACGFYFVEV